MHKRSDGPLTLYDLSDGDARASLCPERGALVTSLQWRGRERIYLDRTTFLDPSKNVRGGIPVLFPICGPLRDDTMTVDGKSYSMKQHGLARQANWRVVAADTSWIELALAADEATLSHYPWDFVARIRFTLEARADGACLRLAQSYGNRSATPMPLQFGFHPYFQVDKETLRLEIPATRYHDTVAGSEGSYSGTLDFSRDQLDLQFEDVNAGTAALHDQNGFARVDYPLADFPYVVLWALKGSEFVCLEPWSGPRFGMNTGKALKHVPPGGELSTAVSFTVA